MNEVPIVKIEPKGTPIYKARTMRGMEFVLDVTYHLNDGRTFDGHVSTERKKHLPESLARKQASAQAGCIAASFIDGKFFGTVEKFHIGPRGMTPQPVAA